MRLRFRLYRARWRLRSHMYDRLIMGGTPNCPCSRCLTDLLTLANAGETWDEPELATYYREVYRVLDAPRL